jgi:hypothetical protein
MTTLGDHLRDERNREAGDICFANLQAILRECGAANVAELYRTIYKYNDCGPWLSVRLHDGTWMHCDELHGIDNGNVRSLRVGSIVEGSDAEVTGREIDLLAYDDDEAAVAAFDSEVDDVNTEACRLWDEANTDEGEDA